MIGEWVQSYLYSLKPFLIIKMETYITKQDVHVFNAWFMTEDNWYGLLSVIYDELSILGTMLPRESNCRIGNGRADRKFDLSKYVLFSRRKEDLVINKRFNKRTLENALDKVLKEGMHKLQGLKFSRYLVKSVSVVAHYWRLSIWDSKGLCDVIEVDVFNPKIRRTGLSIEMCAMLEKSLGGVFSEVR